MKLGQLLAALGILLGGVSAIAPEPKPIRVLFVGNSLTTVNDLPAMVEALSARNGGPRLVCSVVAFPDYSLEDHWNRGEARRVIAKGGWNYVVLQQGPSALPESRVLLIDYAKKFDGEARRVGAKTALYMVWPSVARLFDFEGVRTSYADAARAVGGIFLPAGQAWRSILDQNRRIDLYAGDGFHPTINGTYLAALVVCEELSGRRPEKRGNVPIAADVAASLGKAAADAVAAQRP